MSKDHFEGRNVAEHLLAARKKGLLAVAEVHGTEMPGHIAAAADAARDTAFFLLLLWLILPFPSLRLLIITSCALMIWKTGRSALLGWSRLERMHRLIEEEKWEIEHNRQQERQELTAMYRAKGLTGKLLDEVITVLMSDDNRLLQIMLEEELGLTLEIHEHPLKQSAGAALGVIGSAILFIGTGFLHLYAPLVSAFIIVMIASYISVKTEKNRPLEAIIWQISVLAFSAGACFFIARVL